MLFEFLVGLMAIWMFLGFVELGVTIWNAVERRNARKNRRYRRDD